MFGDNSLIAVRLMFFRHRRWFASRSCQYLNRPLLYFPVPGIDRTSEKQKRFSEYSEIFPTNPRISSNFLSQRLAFVNAYQQTFSVFGDDFQFGRIHFFWSNEVTALTGSVCY